MVEIIFKSLKSHQPHKLDTFKPGSWINIVNPDELELDSVCEQLNLDTLTVRDALDPYEVPRIERENGSIYVFTRAPGLVSNQVQTSPLLLVVTPDYFVTVSKDPLEILHKLQNSPSLVSTTQKTKFFLMLLLDINSAYSHQINDIRKKVRLFTSDIQHISNQNIIQLVDFQSVFNDLLSSLEPLSMTFNQLLSGKYLPLYEADQDLAEDLKIGTDQLVQLCRSNIKAISTIREAYASIISNNLNRTVKFLTAVTLILTIPTAIASFFGMNVGLPLSNHPMAFILIVISTLAITTLVWLVLWRKDYL